MNNAGIQTEPELKVEAEKVARALGTDLISVVNNWLRKFIRNKTIDLREPEEIPNARLRRIMKQAEKNFKAGKHSPVLETGEEAVAWLEKHGI